MTDLSGDPRLTPAPAAAYGVPSRAGGAIAGDDARTLFGRVMGLVALTVGCAALGAYVGRDLSGGTGIAAFIAAFACVFGLNAASAAGRRQPDAGAHSDLRTARGRTVG